MIAIAIISGILLRLYNMLDYQAFSLDQARDAFVYAGMKHGIWPTLGPVSAYGSYSLPPTYYYLVFPFSLLSNQPVFQVIPNFIASCAVLVLLPLYCIRFLFHGVSKRARLAAAALAAAWGSTSLSAVAWASAEWNPFVMPVFVLLDLMILSKLLERSQKRQLLLWAAAGLVNGVLIGVHSTTMFVIPVFFGLFSLYNLIRYHEWRGVAVAWLVLAATLAPYAYGEVAHHFANTQLIIQAASQTQKSSPSMRVEQAIQLQAYATGQTLISSGSSGLPLIMNWVSLIVLLPVWTLFRKERYMAVLLGLLWAIFITIGSSYTGTILPHYVLLVFFVPFLMLLGGTIYYSQNKTTYLPAAICLVLILFSIYHNVKQDVALVRTKMTSPALASVTNMQEALSLVPSGGTICVTQDVSGEPNVEYQYLDEYTSKRHHQFTKACKAGDYEIQPVEAHLSSRVSTVSVTGTLRIVRWT